MKKVVRIQVKRLREGPYLAASKDVQGLVAQGYTIEVTLEIARDVTKKLLEARKTKNEPSGRIKNTHEFPLIVGKANGV